MTQGVKVPSALTKKECLAELQAFQVVVSSDLTIQELRFMVKQTRIQEGLMEDRKGNKTTMMSMIEQASLAGLRKLASEHKVGFPSSMEHGALRLHMRQWTIRSAPEKTIVHFGKHKGKSLEAIWNNDAQYVEWCVKEAASKKEAGGDSDRQGAGPLRCEDAPGQCGRQVIAPNESGLHHGAGRRHVCGEARGGDEGRPHEEGGCCAQLEGLPGRFIGCSPDRVSGGSAKAGGHVASGASCLEGESGFGCVTPQPQVPKGLEHASDFNPSCADGSGARASCGDKVLSPGECRALDRACADFQFEIHKALRDPNQLFFLEVACGEASVLTEESAKTRSQSTALQLVE